MASVVHCAGDGRGSLALVDAAPALEPVRSAGSPATRANAPGRPHRCAMRFQIQQDK